MRLTRREFDLPEPDTTYLESLGLPWETALDGKKRWVIVHDWGLCEGYNHLRVSVALLLAPTYPDAQIDMVHVCPSLRRTDGKPIANLTASSVCGGAWQQWSRHRTPNNPWRIGVDDLSTHLALVDHWFAREFERNN